MYIIHKYGDIWAQTNWLAEKYTTKTTVRSLFLSTLHTCTEVAACLSVQGENRQVKTNIQGHVDQPHVNLGKPSVTPFMTHGHLASAKNF